MLDKIVLGLVDAFMKYFQSVAFKNLTKRTYSNEAVL